MDARPTILCPLDIIRVLSFCHQYNGNEIDLYYICKQQCVWDSIRCDLRVYVSILHPMHESVCVCVLNSELFLWRVQIIHCSNDWRLDFPIRKVREKRFKWLNECVLGSVCVRCAWTRIWRIAPDEHEWDEINNKLFTLFRLGKIPSLHPYLIPPLQPQP